MTNTLMPVGDQLRGWRQRRRRSQMDLALDAEISTRHLSFIETGRSRPSREMIDRLARQLDIPARETNSLLLAAGFAPSRSERSLSEPEMNAARSAIEHLLAGYEPFPALAVDRHWNIVASNAAIGLLTEQAASHLLEGDVNALRLALHPDGLAPQIVNFAEWREHLLERLDRQVEQSGDAALVDLRKELESYAAPRSSNDNFSHNPVAVPLVLDTIVGRMSFLSTTTIFGTPLDVTLSEIAIEAFFPADEATRKLLVE